MIDLGTIAEFKNGKALAPDKYTALGKWPVYGSNGEIAKTDQILNSHPVISIGRVGAYCGAVYAIRDKSWVTDNAIIAMPKEDNDFNFLYYLLIHLKLNRIAIGSAQPLLTQSGLKVVPINTPPSFEKQKIIGQILKSFDDKIELNQKTNESLESIAKIIFKEWFIDFGPVKSKSEGKSPINLSKEAAALFPSTLEDSELGMIPKGWKCVKINEFCSLEYGKNLSTTELKTEGFPVYGAARVIGFHTESLYKEPVVLITCRGNGSGDILETQEEAFVTNNSIAIIPREKIFRHFLRWYLLSIDTSTVVTGSAQPQITIANLKSLNLLIPDKNVYAEFYRLAESLWQKKRNNDLENASLQKIRDTLIAQLISGELQLNEVASD